MKELIDREATVKQICKMGEMLGIGHDRDVTIAVALFVQDDKSAFPTIERPHGEWVKKEYQVLGISYTSFLCSACKFEVGECSCFCPNCGADMRVKSDEENQNPCIKCGEESACQGICEKRYLWNLRKEGETNE